MTNVTVISVMYNGEGIVNDYFESLANNKYIKQIIVVDNASTDLTYEKVQEHSVPNVVLLQAGANVGFGNGCNIGLEKVQTPYALLLNPDAKISEESLGELLSCAKQNPDAAIVVPRIVLGDGSYQESYKKKVFIREKSGGKFIVPDGDLCADFLSGAVMLWNMDLMRKVGFFDPNIFLFYEDDDICLRVRDAGYGLVCTPRAIAQHEMGGSTTLNRRVEHLKQYHLCWSRLYLQQKYYGGKSALKLALFTLMLFLLKSAGYSVVGRFGKARRYKARMGGVIGFLRGINGR
jgi:N-acetylglucosaminyl-diphospho-decaprenol L-rhamnosyltransferase